MASDRAGVVHLIRSAPDCMGYPRLPRTPCDRVVISHKATPHTQGGFSSCSRLSFGGRLLPRLGYDTCRLDVLGRGHTSSCAA